MFIGEFGEWISEDYHNKLNIFSSSTFLHKELMGFFVKIVCILCWKDYDVIIVNELYDFAMELWFIWDETT